MSQSDDMEAINNAISGTSTRNGKAFDLQTAWRTWYDDLSWWAKSTDSGVLATAKRKRAEFFKANKGPVVSPSPRAATPDPTTVQMPGVLIPGTIAKRLNVDPDPAVRAPVGKPMKHPTLRLGYKGPAVTEWVKLMFPGGNLTAVENEVNYYGPKTQAATKEWQKTYGLTSDGVVGPKSWMTAHATSYSPAAIPSAVHAADGSLPSASGVVTKRALIAHVKDLSVEVKNKGLDPATTDLSKVKDEGISKTAIVAGVGALFIGGVIYAVKKSGQL